MATKTNNNKKPHLKLLQEKILIRNQIYQLLRKKRLKKTKRKTNKNLKNKQLKCKKNNIEIYY